jgi:hypothetical protein
MTILHQHKHNFPMSREMLNPLFDKKVLRRCLAFPIEDGLEINRALFPVEGHDRP